LTHIKLKCNECFNLHDSDMSIVNCELCDGTLDVEYISTQNNQKQINLKNGMRMIVPLNNPEKFVSLGEGNTPVLRFTRIEKELSLDRVFGKLEFMNPTGSFKDRGTFMMVSMALESNIDSLVEDSSGNAGASLSAYCAKTGLKAHIFAPESAPASKLGQIKTYGAEVHLIKGSRDYVTSEAKRFYKENNYIYASHVLSPYYVEGTKTFAYEIANQFDYNLPENIVFPVGNGSLIIGCWKGLNELFNNKKIDKIPRLHCVQAEQFVPVIQEIKGDTEKNDLENPFSVAGGISVSSPARKKEVSEIVKNSFGTGVSVSDEEIIEWQKFLARREGIFCEPTSATVFAALKKLFDSNEIQSKDSVLVPVTGFGLKDKLFV